LTGYWRLITSGMRFHHCHRRRATASPEQAYAQLCAILPGSKRGGCTAAGKISARTQAENRQGKSRCREQEAFHPYRGKDQEYIMAVTSSRPLPSCGLSWSLRGAAECLPGIASRESVAVHVFLRMESDGAGVVARRCWARDRTQTGKPADRRNSQRGKDEAEDLS